MFRQYQRQESGGSLSTIRTISGVSQSSETMECVNGPPAEEAAPSTVIELTVDELSQKSPDSASSSTITSSPQETADERGHASITVSNILARAEEEERELVQEPPRDGSGDGKDSEATVTQKTDTEEQSEETNEQEAMTETSTDKDTDNIQTSTSNPPDTTDTKVVEVVKDSATMSASDDSQTPTDDEQNKGESSNSITEDSLNEADTELPAVSEQDGKADQTSLETTACLENSVLGGASVFNEDLVDVSSVSDQIHPSDADESQEESSYASAAGEESEVLKKEEDKHDNEGNKNDQEGQEFKTEEEKDEKQEVSTDEKARESETEEKRVSDLESPPTETPEQNVTELPKEKDEQSSPIAKTTTSDQQPSDTTLPSTAQEVAAAPDPTSPSQPSETSGTTGGETVSSAPDSSTTVSSSDPQKSADFASKTKEIKIARLDVSNVALDTERLELKETSTTVRIYFLFFLNFGIH